MRPGHGSGAAVRWGQIFTTFCDQTFDQTFDEDYDGSGLNVETVKLPLMIRP